MSEMNSSSEALNSLKRGLHDMFQVQNNDLDFGIFRILNIKRNEIEEFIDNKLSKVVEEAISDVAEKLYNKQHIILLLNDQIDKIIQLKSTGENNAAST